MRQGFTTGSCAAAAAKAATYMLLSGKRKDNIEIETPAGKMFAASIVDIEMTENAVSCAVIKDGGDDPDVTTGAHICARVEYTSDATAESITIDGGTGVGRVTKPGLNQPVGNAAINSVPRQMIVKEVEEVRNFFDYKDKLKITISVPEGIELADKTFNPRLGIVGGISILGTTGIVEPMSNQALIETIRVELNQKYAMGYRSICISPGNYGLDFMKANYDFNLDYAVKCSNFIGLTLDMACETGFEEILLIGHMGKLVKLAGGIMNTHSKEADCRMEIMTSLLLKACEEAGITPEISEFSAVLNCVNTEEAYSHILSMAEKHRKEENANKLTDYFSKLMMFKINENLNRRVNNRASVECMVYSNVHGLIGATDGACSLLEKIRKELD